MQYRAKTTGEKSTKGNTMEMNTMEMLENMVAAGIYETIEEAIDEYALSCKRRLK